MSGIGNVAGDDVDAGQPDAKILHQARTGGDGGGMDHLGQAVVLGCAIFVHGAFEDDHLPGLGDGARRQVLRCEIGLAFAVNADGAECGEGPACQPCGVFGVDQIGDGVPAVADNSRRIAAHGIEEAAIDEQQAPALALDLFFGDEVRDRSARPTVRRGEVRLAC